MIIREFTERDIDEITPLMKKLCELTGKEFDEERWRRSLEQKMENDSETQVFVAFDKQTNQVLGMAHSSVKKTENGFRFGYISNLIVKEEQRRSGIGEQLIRHIIDYFRRNHIHSIRLALKKNINSAANVLFTKLGFKEKLRVLELKI
ncbi:MAG: GNAT family N-acetyltransferase [Promethearchaeota archaeon]|nr:MAG: GNAT family N-acetyltransferase [Candidatus Lokiarchaeota archaeon]